VSSDSLFNSKFILKKLQTR